MACVRDIANPVSLARKVMEETSHCLLCGEGAMKFANQINFPMLNDPQELITNDSVCKSFQIAKGILIFPAGKLSLKVTKNNIKATSQDL